MSRSPRASIVMPLRSQADGWLRAAVASALMQTVTTEVIVVTSPHTPASNRAILDDAARSKNLITFERPAGAGFADAINLGFRAATCRRVGLLLSDDWLSPDAVERCIDLDAEIVGTARQAYAADGLRRLWRASADQARFDRMKSLQERASYLGHFLVLERSTMLQAGGVDPTIGLTGADDYDLVWTMLERGATVRLIPEALYHYRDHEGERLTLRDRAAQIADLRKILAKHGVGAEETERLVGEKSKWYGAACQTAIDDPQWYLKPSKRPEGTDDGGA